VREIFLLRLLLFVVGILVLSILAIIAIGYSLPVSHVATRAIVLREKPEQVFALISDFKDEPAWRSDVRRVEILPEEDGHTRFRETSTHGAITMVVLESTPPQRLVSKIEGKNLPFGGRWIFDIFPAAEGCRLNITERGEIYNPVFRFVSRYMIGYTGTIDGYLRSAAKKLGEGAQLMDGIPAE
jgi:hypothetical protein